MNARIFLCLITAALCAPLPLVAQDAQQQSEVQAPVIRVIELKYATCHQVHDVVASLMRDVRVAVDPRTNSIIVSGRKASVDEVERFVGELDHPQQESTPPRRTEEEKPRYRVTLYYVAGDFGAKDRTKMGAPIPAAVKPAAKVLEDAGMTNLSLITTSLVTVQDAAEFRMEGSWPTSANLYRVFAKGSVFGSSDTSSVSVDLNCELFRWPTEESELGSAGNPNRPVFNFASTIRMEPGEYVVVGSSPAASGIGDAIALIVMVQPSHVDSH